MHRFLINHLINREFFPCQINSVIEIWAGHNKSVIGKLRQRSLAPKQVKLNPETKIEER